MKRLTVSENITSIDIEGDLENVIAYLTILYTENRNNYTNLRVALDYDEYECNITLAGDRVENDAEFEKRAELEERLKKAEKARKDKELEQARKLYEKLKKKFEK